MRRAAVSIPATIAEGFGPPEDPGIPTVDFHGETRRILFRWFVGLSPDFWLQYPQDIKGAALA